MIAIAFAVVLIALLAATAIRFPLIRRLGLRNAVRRPREAMLVMLGCVLGTALIVGSASVGTSFTTSLRDRALTHVGPVDARVGYDNRDDWSNANERLNAAPDAAIRSATAIATLEVPVTADSSPTAIPRARLIEADYRRTGILNADGSIPVGTGPTAGTAWASTILAQHLNLKVNDVLTIHSKLPGQVRVTRIIDTPLVAFQDNVTETGDNVLVSPGTIAILQAQDPTALIPQFATLVVGAGSHDESVPAKGRVDALESRLTRALGPFNPHIAMVRSDRLALATKLGNAAGVFLTTLGAFGILAGFLLLVNVLLMLAEERLAELGTMRAVGMSRHPLVASFSLEGALYALVGSAIGGVVGIALGRFMVFISQAIAKTPDPTTGIGLDIQFAIDRATVANGVAAGFVVATLVVIATSYRVSRLDVIRSLRGLPDPPRPHRRAATPLLVAGIVAGPIVSLIGYRSIDTLAFLLGMPLCFACIGVFVSRRGSLDRALTVACGPNLVWAIVCTIYSRDPNPPPAAAVVVGIVLVASGTLFANAQQARLAGWIRRFGRGQSTVTTRLGLANPIAHRVRMLLTVGPFALVVFTLVYAEGLSHMITTELDRLGPRINGDYQVFATSSPVNPFDFDKVESPNVFALARTSTTFAAFTTAAITDQQVWQLTAFTRDLTQVDPPRLVNRAKGYASDEAAFRAVSANPDLVIVPANFLLDPQDRVRPPVQSSFVGDVITMYDPVTSNARDLTIVAVTYPDVLGTGVFYGDAGARDFFGGRLRPNSAFISTGGDPDVLVDQLQRAGVDSGLEAFEVGATSHRFFSFVSDSVTLYRADLGIGIVVGVAGIGVVLVRSVRDRRRQIGTLRAMGFEASQIGRSFLVEGSFIAAQGLAVGVGMGVALTMAITRAPSTKSLFGYLPDIVAPDTGVVVMTALLLIGSLLASVGPARAASRIPPAVALRLVD